MSSISSSIHSLNPHKCSRFRTPGRARSFRGYTGAAQIRNGSSCSSRTERIELRQARLCQHVHGAQVLQGGRHGVVQVLEGRVVVLALLSKLGAEEERDRRERVDLKTKGESLCCQLGLQTRLLRLKAFIDI